MQVTSIPTAQGEKAKRSRQPFTILKKIKALRGRRMSLFYYPARKSTLE
jgi:hypothetical protein